MTIVERRKFSRVLLNVKVKYAVLKGSNRRAEETRSKNVSTGGMCLMLSEKIDIGDLLRLRLSFHGEKDFVIVKGKVVRVEEFSINHTSNYKAYDCGIEFFDVDTQDQKRISRYLKSPSSG